VYLNSRRRNGGKVSPTHELASIFALADRVIMLEKSTKSIIAEGTPHTLKNECENPYVCSFFNRQINYGKARS